MLIDSKGHIKLTDFGLSRVGLLDRQEDNQDWKLNRAFMKDTDDEEYEQTGTVGTPDYIAPEVFLGTDSGPGVDWWALGCILYEFLVGITPFYGDSMEEIFQNILAKQIMWPSPEDDNPVPEDAKDLITKLLAFEPSDRLGANGVEEIKQHPWFAGIEWETLREKKAVMVPNTSDIFDTSYFDARQDIYDVDENDILEEEDEEEDEGNEKEDRRGDQTRFRGFSFMNLTHLASANTDE